MIAHQAASRRLLRRTGFFLFMTAVITVAALAGAGPVRLLLLFMVADLSFLAAVEGMVNQKAVGGDRPGDREECGFMALFFGTAGAVVLVVTATYTILPGDTSPRTEAVFLASLGMIGVSLIGYGITKVKGGI